MLTIAVIICLPFRFLEMVLNSDLMERIGTITFGS